MSWWVVLIILIAGWILVFLELFFIPGTMVFAVMGTLTMITGIVIAYSSFGVIGGSLTLGGTAIVGLLLVVYGFKKGPLKGLTLRTRNEGKVNEIDESKIKVGDQGTAMSKIAPMGKGLFHDEAYEVQSQGEWIISGKPIEVIRVDVHKIFVKEKNK
ncbi:MAG: NfeD family protein [Chitinophagales bacterium]